MGNNVACGNPGEFTSECTIDCVDQQCAQQPAPVDILCPEAAVPCRVNCIGPNSCDGVTIRCGGGPCFVSCQSGACDATTTVVCGPNECRPTCAAGQPITVQTTMMTCVVDDATCEP
jgi:hypothetical protein